VAIADLRVAKTTDTLTPAHPECLGGLQNEPTYRVGGFSEARLNLLQAILSHGGEASQVIANFNGFSSGQNQDILNSLRGL
jgi:hypothetical protein